MRNQPSLRFLVAAPLLALAAAASGCGDSPTLITVQGKTLTVSEMSYTWSGTQTVPGNFCQPLFMSQYEIFISDFNVCQSAKQKASNTTAFHSTENAHLQIVIPTAFQKNPNGTFKQNDFTVKPTNFCKQSGGGAAVAVFSHNPAGAGVYDVNVEATAGTISVTEFSSNAANIKGTYDLTFGADHITGTFDAFPCSAIDATYGWMR